MPNSIDDAIAQAQEAAKNTVPSTQSTAGTAVAPAQRGTPLTFGDMNTGGINVSAWLKVGEYGLSIGQDRTLFDSLDVEIDLSEIKYCYSVRYGNPAQYAKSYDRQTDVRGGSWINTIAKAQAVDPKANEFRSADIPFKLLKDAKSKDGKTVIAKAGDLIGHSLSITGWASFSEFMKALQNAGVNVENDKVEVKLGFEVKTNAKGTWGILSFSDPKVVEEDPE